MNENSRTNGTVRKGLAISGLIIGLTALLCAFLYGWRIFAIVLATMGIAVSVFSLRKALMAGKSRIMQTIGLASSVIAIPLAAYFLYTGPPEKPVLEGDKMPAKINEKGWPGSVDKNLKRLKEAGDTMDAK